MWRRWGRVAFAPRACSQPSQPSNRTDPFLTRALPHRAATAGHRAKHAYLVFPSRTSTSSTPYPTYLVPSYDPPDIRRRHLQTHLFPDHPIYISRQSRHHWHLPIPTDPPVRYHAHLSEPYPTLLRHFGGNLTKTLHRATNVQMTSSNRSRGSQVTR